MREEGVSQKVFVVPDPGALDGVRDYAVDYTGVERGEEGVVFL